MHDLATRLYRTKMVLTSLVLVVVGVISFLAGNWLNNQDGLSWLAALPWQELGGILVGGGILSIWLDRFLSGEQQALDDQRLRALLRDYAPTMRDAVLEAFAANHDDLARVATPQLLDQIITNSLALRLDDHDFAADIYTDIRDQAITATERWQDAELSIELSPRPPSKVDPDMPQQADDLFEVTVRWEYTTVPAHARRRFVCLSDRDEYTEIMHRRDNTSAWYLKPRRNLDASTRDAFELLRFTVDGQEQPIRRSARKTSQTYTSTVGSVTVDARLPVTIAYTYRTVTTQAGHLLFFDIEQPTKDLRVNFDYSGTNIANVSTLDLVPSIRPTRIEHNPEPLPHDAIRVHLNGWTFPRSGIAFVWTLNNEIMNRQPTKAAAK